MAQVSNVRRISVTTFRWVCLLFPSVKQTRFSNIQKRTKAEELEENVELIKFRFIEHLSILNHFSSQITWNHWTESWKPANADILFSGLLITALSNLMIVSWKHFYYALIGKIGKIQEWYFLNTPRIRMNYWLKVWSRCLCQNLRESARVLISSPIPPKFWSIALNKTCWKCAQLLFTLWKYSIKHWPQKLFCLSCMISWENWPQKRINESKVIIRRQLEVHST